METDFSKILRPNQDIVRCITLSTPIEGLYDNVIYIMSGGSSKWHSAIKALESIEQIKEYNIYELTESILPPETAEAFLGANIILPLFFSDLDAVCYLTDYVEEPTPIDLEASIYHLTDDAHALEQEASFLSFLKLSRDNPQQAKNLWNSLETIRDYNPRGKYSKMPSEYAFLGRGFEKKEESLMKNYTDRVEYLKKFPNTIEGIKASLDVCKKDFRGICDSLSISEKNELILELAKRVSTQAELSNALDSVINKGMKSKLIIRVEEKGITEIQDIDARFRMGGWRTFLVDKETKKSEWLDFEPSAHVLYLMNLIYRVRHKEGEPERAIGLTSHTNQKAFLRIFEEIYGGGDDALNRLIRKSYANPDGKGYLRNRTPDCYKIIANCINQKCIEMGESPAPYLATQFTPLTIEPKLIELPEKFKSIEVY